MPAIDAPAGLDAFGPTLLGVSALMLLTFCTLWSFGVRQKWGPVLAILRGALQLAAISFVLGYMIASPGWIAVALLVMFAIAAATATGRIGWSGAHAVLVVVAMGVGIAVTMGVVFATGAIDFTPRYVLAIGGIVIGGAMTIATLAGRRITESVIDRWEEVEGWLALGATPRQSTLSLAREAVHSALIPSLDQTKNTGLVTLPGAFVGAIFGGLSPLEAGRFQIVVLASLMAVGAITSVIVIAVLAPARRQPVRLR